MFIGDRLFRIQKETRGNGYHVCWSYMCVCDEREKQPFLCTTYLYPLAMYRKLFQRRIFLATNNDQIVKKKNVFDFHFHLSSSSSFLKGFFESRNIYQISPYIINREVLSFPLYPYTLEYPFTSFRSSVNIFYFKENKYIFGVSEF